MKKIIKSITSSINSSRKNQLIWNMILCVDDEIPTFLKHPTVNNLIFFYNIISLKKLNYTERVMFLM